MDKDLKNKTIHDLEQMVVELGKKTYLANYIFSFIHAHDATEIDDITPLPKAFRQKLTDAGFYISRLKTVRTFTDPDGTIKFLFEASDGVRFEAVLLIDAGAKKRKTLCISCQAGCRMACRFCATGALKFERDLTAAEIADQLNQAVLHSGAVNNVVYMGMGEPFDNYDEVIRSAKIINHTAGKNIGQRHITISTCGITEGIDRFAAEQLQVRLAVSLHAPTDNVRRKIMAIAKDYPLDKLMQSLHNYQQQTNRRITFEYCMIRDLNDSDQDARALARLIKPLKAGINLIEYNPHDNCRFKASTTETIQRFKDLLTQAGFETIIRFKRGRSIKAACGQLGADLLNKPQHD